MTFARNFSPAFRGAFSDSGIIVTYILRDEFTTPETAPITTPRTMEPGPGTWIVSDAGNAVSISGGLMIKAGTFASQLTTSAVLPYSIGICVKSRYRLTTGGWIVGIASAGFGSGFMTNDNLYDMAGTQTTMGEAVNTSFYIYAVIRNATRNIFVANNKIKFVDNIANTNNYVIRQRGIIAAYAGEVDYVRAAVLGSPWNIEYGLCTYRDATPSANDTATSESNNIQYIEWTAGAGETFDLSVRRTDDDNRWIVRCSQAGSTIKLIERNVGVETERASAAQTFTASIKYRIGVVCDAEVIISWVDNAIKNNYASAAFNQSATECKIAGGATLENWEIYPRNLSGSALAQLAAV